MLNLHAQRPQEVKRSIRYYKPMPDEYSWNGLFLQQHHNQLPVSCSNPRHEETTSMLVQEINNGHTYVNLLKTKASIDK